MNLPYSPNRGNRRRFVAASVLVSAGAFVVAAPSPASAHQYCDAETVATYADDGSVDMVTTTYTELSDLGETDEAVDGLCQARPVVTCVNDDGEGILLYGNWSNGNGSIQAALCPSSFPTIGGFGHQTAYDGDILPA